MSSTNRQSLIQRQKRARMNSLVDRMQEDAYAIHVVACQSVSQSINRSLLLSPTDEVSVILYALNGGVYNVSSNRDEVFKPSLTIRNSRHIVFATCVKLIYKQTATYLKLLYMLWCYLWYAYSLYFWHFVKFKLQIPNEVHLVRSRMVTVLICLPILLFISLHRILGAPIQSITLQSLADNSSMV